METTNRLSILIGTFLVLAGALGASWAAGELAGGAADIPRHWWSTMAALPLVAGAAVLLLSVMRPGSRRIPRTIRN
jgi:uncharacterized membrane protein YgdD (TMEM256/DUF423 family)